RRSISHRMHAKLRELRVALRRRRHVAIPAQGRWLAQVIRGYYAYHAVPTNFARLVQFRQQVIWHWYRALKRRSQRDRTTWERLTRLAAIYLPRARILHPWPEDRFDVTTRGKSPVR